VASKKQLAWRKKFAALAKAGFKKAKKSVKSKQSFNNKKDSTVKGQSKKRSGKKRRTSSGGGTKRRSHKSGGATTRSRSRRKSSGGSFDLTKIITTIAVSVAMVFGVTYLVNMVLNKFNLSPDRSNIAKWALTLGLPALVIYFAKKYPAVQAAAVATLAFAVFNWAKTVLPVGAQTALAGFPQAPYNPLAPGYVTSTAQASGTLTPQPLS